jgi:hypothetical protein
VRREPEVAPSRSEGIRKSDRSSLGGNSGALGRFERPTFSLRRVTKKVSFLIAFRFKECKINRNKDLEPSFVATKCHVRRKMSARRTVFHAGATRLQDGKMRQGLKIRILPDRVHMTKPFVDSLETDRRRGGRPIFDPESIGFGARVQSRSRKDEGRLRR